MNKKLSEKSIKELKILEEKYNDGEISYDTYSKECNEIYYRENTSKENY